MPVPTVRVFVSSTWRDLEPERQEVEKAIHRMRETKFVGMEHFGSRDEATRRASLDEVDRSEVYVGIFGARYGSGIIEAEYRRAHSRGLPCLIYFKDDATITDDGRETDPAQTERLNALKQELRADHIIGPDFVNPHDLAAKVTADLHRWLQTLLAQLTARHQLRAPVGDFVGREKEIATLTDALRRGGSAGISGISGMGGIGKTELALYVAARLRDAYPDAQLFIDMRGTDDPPRDAADALADCIRAFAGLEQRLPEALDDLLKLYRAELDGKRALILLDNARDAAQVRPLLPPAGSALLVTSRDAIPLPGMKTRITLEQLQPAEARELLTGIAPRVPADIADQICYLCGYLPLAIRAAGSLLDITADLDPADYAQQLNDERQRLELIGTEGVDLGVEASISLSYNRLSPDAARVFRLLSVFPATFDAPAEEVICQDPQHKHLSDLLRRNLVLYKPDTCRYRLHDLVRLFAAARMKERERNAGQMRHSTHYKSVLTEANNLYLQGGEAIKRGLTLFDLEWRNIQAGQICAEKQSGRNATASSLCADYPDAGAHLLQLRQHPRERIRWLETALVTTRRSKNRAADGSHLGNLGSAYLEKGEMRSAIECYEKQLVLARKIGVKHGESDALTGMGIAYKHLGELGRAIDYHEQALAIDRSIGDRRREGGTLGNLGSTYLDLGDTCRAIEYFEQALVIMRECGDIHTEGSLLGNLGVAYKILGEYRRAVEFHKQSLAIAREISDESGEGTALYNTSLALDMLGDRAQAIAHAEAALEILEQIESPNAKIARAALAQWREEGQRKRGMGERFLDWLLRKL